MKKLLIMTVCFVALFGCSEAPKEKETEKKKNDEVVEVEKQDNEEKEDNKTVDKTVDKTADNEKEETKETESSEVIAVDKKGTETVQKPSTTQKPTTPTTKPVVDSNVCPNGKQKINPNLPCNAEITNIGIKDSTDGKYYSTRNEALIAMNVYLEKYIIPRYEEAEIGFRAGEAEVWLNDGTYKWIFSVDTWDGTDQEGVNFDDGNIFDDSNVNEDEIVWAE